MLLMVFSLPFLIAGWAFAASGVYFLFAPILGLHSGENGGSLAVMWSLIFAFGVISISVLLAAQAKFAEIALIRTIYKWSIAGAAALFLGYSLIGLIMSLAILVDGYIG